MSTRLYEILQHIDMYVHVFFFGRFVESENDPRTDPVVLWLVRVELHRSTNM